MPKQGGNLDQEANTYRQLGGLGSKHSRCTLSQQQDNKVSSALYAHLNLSAGVESAVLPDQALTAFPSGGRTSTRQVLRWRLASKLHHVQGKSEYYDPRRATFLVCSILLLY